MHHKLIIAITMVILVTVTASPVQRAPLNLINFIALEEPCVRQGGVCLMVEDCAEDNLVQIRGVLCPKQRHLGVECCYL